MSLITDEFMRQMLGTTKPYTVVILRRTAKRDEPGADQIIWEHGRRNFRLREEGTLRIVCPARNDGSGLAGLCVFRSDVKETERIMADDPAIKAGILDYEAHVVEGFPGDHL